MQKLLSFLQQNISVFGNKVVKHITSWPLNQLVKLTMLWTTGPSCILEKKGLGHTYIFLIDYIRKHSDLSYHNFLLDLNFQTQFSEKTITNTSSLTLTSQPVYISLRFQLRPITFVLRQNEVVIPLYSRVLFSMCHKISFCWLIFCRVQVLLRSLSFL